MKSELRSGKFVARQGDVLIEWFEGPLPATAKAVGGRAILAHGEVTGHCHEVVMKNDPAGAGHKAQRKKVGIKVWEVKEGTDALDAMLKFVEVSGGGAVVVHQEHAAVALAKGRYRVRRQREYSPAEIRRVAD